MNRGDIFNEQASAAILEQIAAGSEQAFRQLFDHYAGRLCGFAFSIIKNREAALEIVDEVFVKFWRQRVQAPAIQNLRTYLYTATKNASLNYLSSKAHLQTTDPFDFINVQLQDEGSPEQQLITAEILDKIRAAVEELPPRCKMIFKLVREDNLRYKEVAGILNLSVNTVDAQMVIAVRRISEKVRAHFDRFPQPAARKK